MSMSSPGENAVVRMYLANVQSALANGQYQHAELLLQHAMQLMSASPQQNTTSIRLSSGIGLDTGLTRKGYPNEDYTFAAQGVLPTQEYFGLFLVADGMGGHSNGQKASRLAAETMVDYVIPRLYAKQRGSPEDDLFSAAAQQANAVIFAQNRGMTHERDKMGTTLAAVLVVDTAVTVINVGDSRVYRYRPGVGLVPLTRDHSVVQEMIERGLIDPEDVYTHPRKNEITRCLGTGATVQVDVYHEDLCDGDVLLLCSDGLWEMTRDTQIEQIVRQPCSAEQMAGQLVQLARNGGGRDNIGIVVVQASMKTVVLPKLIRQPYPLLAS
jgi:serine/threonine protein phosphatase PrpC